MTALAVVGVVLRVLLPLCAVYFYLYIVLVVVAAVVISLPFWRGLLFKDPEPRVRAARPKRGAAAKRRDEPMPLDPVVMEVLESLRQGEPNASCCG